MCLDAFSESHVDCFSTINLLLGICSSLILSDIYFYVVSSVYYVAMVLLAKGLNCQWLYRAVEKWQSRGVTGELLGLWY